MNITWNDSEGAKVSVLQGFYFYSQGPSAQTNFYPWFVDTNGIEKKMDALAANAVVVAPSGATWSTPMSIDIPTGNSLTADIR